MITTTMSSNNINLAKTVVKMEEQLVPSAGYSPQSNSYGTDYTLKFSSYGFGSSSLDDCSTTSNYCNLADTFDLSLLGDSYDDQDMATVPSPSWSPMNSMNEQTCWHQSFYASSPSGDFNAYSPDCKPILANDVGTSPIHTSSYDNYEPHFKNGSSGGLVQALASNNGNRNLLLRQCLEDTSFQQKFNFKPMDLPPMTINQAREMANNTPTPEDVGSCLELNQIEPVFSLAFEQMRSEIQNTCTALAISPDPMQWSCSDVQSWLTNTVASLSSGMTALSNNNLASISEMCQRQFWNIEGRRLCSLNEEEFRRLDPVNGDYIFAQFELWKMLQAKVNVGESTSTSPNVLQSIPPMQQQQQQQQQQAFDLDQLLLGSDLQQSGSSLRTSIDTSISSIDAADKDRKSPTLSMDSSSNSSSCSSEHVMSPARSSASSFPSPCGQEPMNTDDEGEESEEDVKPIIIKTEFGSPAPSGTISNVASPSPSTSSSAAAPAPTTTTTKTTKAKSSSTLSGTSKTGAHIHLWQFLKELLASPQQHGSCIRWLDQTRGVFKIEDSVRVARLWGLRKNRPAMNYDKLSRSIRQYYRKGIMRKTERSQRLVYQFCHPYGL